MDPRLLFTAAAAAYPWPAAYADAVCEALAEREAQA